MARTRRARTASSRADANMRGLERSGVETPPTATMRAARVGDILPVDPSATRDDGRVVPGRVPAVGPTWAGRRGKLLDDETCSSHRAPAGLTAIAPENDALMTPYARHHTPDPSRDVRPGPRRTPDGFQRHPLRWAGTRARYPIARPLFASAGQSLCVTLLCHTPRPRARCAHPTTCFTRVSRRRRSLMARLSGPHRVKAREHDWMTFPIVSRRQVKI